MISHLNNQTEKYIELLICLLQKLNAHIVYFQKDYRNYSELLTYNDKTSRNYILTAELIVKEEHKAEVKLFPIYIQFLMMNLKK